MAMALIQTPFNYTGSKYGLLTQLLPNFDYSKPYFVDAFAGGGAVYTNILSEYEEVLVNDIIGDLVGIHQQLMQGDQIIELTRSLCPGKKNPQGFSELRTDYNASPSAAALWALMLSSTNNMMRFNLKFKFNQTYGDRGFSESTRRKVETFTNYIRQYKDKISYKSLPFEQIEIASDKFMFYADPPYGRVKNEGGSMGKGQISQAGYNAFWKAEDDIKLYNYLKSIDQVGSSFMVSGVLEHGGKTCWMLDKLIQDGYRTQELKFDYNKVSRKGPKITKEVIVMNYG